MQLLNLILLIISLLQITITNALVPDKEYALMPDIFHLDNYDNCMLLEEDALFCTFVYALEPIHPENPTKIWRIIQEVSASSKNYRHDLLRHGICVPKSCPKIVQSYQNRTDLAKEINNCYDAKFVKFGLQGKIRKLQCETIENQFPIDAYDISAAIFFVVYLSFVFFASLYEGVARYKSKKEYDQITGTYYGKIISSFSIAKNYYRLINVKDHPDVEKLRSIQGIRCYNMMIVTLSHSILVFLITPVINPKYVETMTEKFMNIFLSSGGLCVSTFFFISSWLLTYNFFVLFEGKKSIPFKVLLSTFFNRYIRLVPTVAVVIIFHCTWLVHLGRGPNWDAIIGTEYRNCRRNWWANLLFINNYVDRENMCLQTIWYLGVDNQTFALSLLGVWLMKRYEKQIPLIIAGMLTTCMGLIYWINYEKDFTAFIVPTPEGMYRLNMFQDDQFHTQVSSFIYNTGGPIIGLLFGYIYYKCRNIEIFTKKIYIWIWWVLILLCPLGIIIFPGLLVFDETVPHSPFWASIYVAVNRPIFAFGIAMMVLGSSQGIGWLVKWTCEFRPTYILGRITFTAYLIQMALVKITPGVIRAPVYITDYLVLSQTLSDIFLSVVCGTLLTLLFEMPISELQKLFVSSGKQVKKDKKG